MTEEVDEEAEVAVQEGEEGLRREEAGVEALMTGEEVTIEEVAEEDEGVLKKEGDSEMTGVRVVVAVGDMEVAVVAEKVEAEKVEAEKVEAGKVEAGKVEADLEERKTILTLG